MTKQKFFGLVLAGCLLAGPAAWAQGSASSQSTGSVSGDVHKVGKAIKHGAKEVGHGVKHVAVEVGHGVKHGAVAVGHGVKHGAEAVGHGVKHGVKAVDRKLHGDASK
jgi:phage-related protein